MNYCTVENVKAQLHISESEWDNEILDCIVSASALVDGILSREGFSVPLLVPQILADATKFFAAWDFRRRRDPAGAEAFWIEANKILCVFIDGEKEPYVGSV